MITQKSPTCWVVEPLPPLDKIKQSLIANAAVVSYEDAKKLAWWAGMSGMPDVCEEIMRKATPPVTVQNLSMWYMGYLGHMANTGP